MFCKIGGIGFLLYLALGAGVQGQTTAELLARNGEQAAEALARCQRVIDAWYTQTGQGNMLLPRTLTQREWRSNDTASDMWAHFVNAAWVLGGAANEARVRGTLLDEIRLTSRAGRMTDYYDIDNNTFLSSTPNIGTILFASSEEVKDGLLPIIDLTGGALYMERARALLEDIMARAMTLTKYGKIPDTTAETNGNMLQSLCRIYSATGDPDYKRWAEQIGDAWIYQVLPQYNGLPVHKFDFATGRALDTKLQLLDHGNEIVVGLVELLAMEYVHDRTRYNKYLPAITGMIDKLLDYARDADGIWVRRINTTDLTVMATGSNDTWGYVTNAVYTLYMLTGTARYRQAVETAMRSIATKPAYLTWTGTQDSWADAIESGILLYNRIPMWEMADWLERIMPDFLVMQKPTGFVEETYLDGNYVRTVLMWEQMKTAGLRAAEWRSDLRLGALVWGSGLTARLSAGSAWSGLLYFDPPRARMNMGLAIDYPRINQYPQWYAVQPEYLYEVYVNGVSRGPMLGQDLIDGLALNVPAKVPVQVTIWPRTGPWIAKK